MKPNHKKTAVLLLRNAELKKMAARKELQELLISECHFRRLFEMTNDGILIVDPLTRKITDANPFMTRLLGYRRKELIGKELFEIGLIKDKKASREMFGKLRRDHKARYENLPLESKTHQRRDVDVVASLYPESGTFKVIQLNIRDITDRRIAEEKARVILEMKARNHELRREIEHRRQTEKETIDISDRERRRIGQDLHDGLGAHLTGVSFLANALQGKMKRKALEEALDVERIVELISDAVDQTRKLARVLSPASLEEHGLMKALEQLASHVSDFYKISCRLNCPHPVLFRDPVAGMNLYRIVQESVHNAIAHGHATRISIALHEKKGGVIRVTVRGNGIKFPSKPPKPGMGLKIMTNRAQALCATFSLRAGKQNGSVMICHMPKPDAVDGLKSGEVIQLNPIHPKKGSYGKKPDR